VGGFSSVTSDETIMFADNASFDGTQRNGKITTDGQVWIGSTASPHVRKGLPTGVSCNSAPVMQANYGSGTLSFENRSWDTAYVVDSSAAAGTRGTFATIQAAINAVFADGAAVGIGYIKIRSGFYAENLSFPSGGNFFIQGPTPINPTGSSNNVVIILGGHTLGDSSILLAENIQFTNSGSVSFNFTGSPSLASFYSCQVDANLATSILLTFRDCTPGNAGSISVSSGSLVAYNSSFNNIVLSGGGLTCYRTSVGAMTLSNAVAPVFYYCTISSFTGSTSGTPEFYNCVSSNATGINYTGNILVSDLSHTNVNPGDFFGSGISEGLALTTQGNVLIRRLVATSATVAKNDYYIGITSTASPRTITLPDTSSTPLKPRKGQCFKFKDQSGGAAANNITITPNGGTIDGAGSYVITTNYGYVELMFDGTNYFKVS
jgi:hypothetical protein